MFLHKENQIMLERELPYSLKYKLAGDENWYTIERIVGDNKLDENTINERGEPENWPLPVRLITTEDYTRIEIPMHGTVFEFCKQRAQNIRIRENNKTGQQII